MKIHIYIYIERERERVGAGGKLKCSIYGGICYGSMCSFLVCQYVYVCCIVYIYIYVCVYICRERERERESEGAGRYTTGRGGPPHVFHRAWGPDGSAYAVAIPVPCAVHMLCCSRLIYVVW